MGLTYKNFYAVEGIDGAGKTSIIDAVRKRRNATMGYTFSKEPTFGYIGEIIKNTKLPSGSAELAVLYNVDTRDHIYGPHGILKVLEYGKVITDRYFFSSLVYQHNITKKLVKDFPLPEKIIFIKTDPEIALKRIKANRPDDTTTTLEMLKEIERQYKWVLQEYEEKLEVIVINNNEENNINKAANILYNIIRFNRQENEYENIPSKPIF